MFMNKVILSGYLTADPQLLRLDSGRSVCRLRIGCPSRRRDRESGRWRQKPNYFDVTVFGEQGETVSRLLGKGAAIGVDGRLDWREWESREGRRAQSVSIIADCVHFMDYAPRQAGQDGGDRPAGRPTIGEADEPVRARSPAESGPPTAPVDDWLSLDAPAQVPGADGLEFDLFAEQETRPTGADDSTERAG